MENTTEKKKIVLSCIQPTGTPTLGNYLGALKNWKNMCDDYNCLYGVADLHSITVPTFRENPAQLKKNTLELYALLIALGIDPEKNVVFVQSHVPTHAQLGWILNCYTQFGEASRMTQFKEKSQKHADNVNVGLFAYPVLMAADILIHNADEVPVGKDQEQHLEMTRNFAKRFNNFYKVDYFKEPIAYSDGTKMIKIPGLDGSGKMGKSEGNCIYLADDPKTIEKKVKKANSVSAFLWKNKKRRENRISLFITAEHHKCSAFFMKKKF